MRVSIHQYDAQLHQPRHSHDTMSVTLLLAGSLRERVGRAEAIAHALSLVVKPVDVEHVNTYGISGARTVQVVLSADEARQVLDANPTLSDWRWTHAGPATTAFLALASAIGRDDTTLVEQRAFEALAAAGIQERVRRVPPHWISHIHQHIVDDPNLTTLTALANDAGVHPVYLARVFRECYGLSVTDFRKRCRVQRTAQRLSLSPQHSLSTVAHDVGYADHSHMCREFRSITGIAPSAFRRIAVGCD